MSMIQTWRKLLEHKTAVHTWVVWIDFNVTHIGICSILSYNDVNVLYRRIIFRFFLTFWSILDFFTKYLGFLFFVIFCTEGVAQLVFCEVNVCIYQKLLMFPFHQIIPRSIMIIENPKYGNKLRHHYHYYHPQCLIFSK